MRINLPFMESFLSRSISFKFAWVKNTPSLFFCHPININIPIASSAHTKISRSCAEMRQKYFADFGRVGPQDNESCTYTNDSYVSIAIETYTHDLI